MTMAAHLEGLPPELAARVDAACRAVSEERLVELVTQVVNIPSPTGDEAPLATAISDELTGMGLRAARMDLDQRQANAWGVLPGSGTGPSLMLYAPLDTVGTGNRREDEPWVPLTCDQQPHATVDGPWVTGLGASNPKGHVACVMAAVEAISQTGGALGGDIIAAFGAGGMPTNARDDDNPRQNVGHGVGVSYLLEQGVHPDFACIAKPGWAISWEEVGLTWFEVIVHGDHTYVGSRHRLPYANPVALASALILRLEEWFPEYTARHTDGLVSPQGMVANIHGGWNRTAAFTPEQVRFMVDLRISPRTSPAQARREFEGAVQAFAAELGAEVEVRPMLSIASSTTDPESWLVRQAVSAWEGVTDSTNPTTDDASGATDAVILRSRGIPTVRVGMPKVRDTPFAVDFARGMNTVDIRDAVRLTHYLIRLACQISASTLSEAEVG